MGLVPSKRSFPAGILTRPIPSKLPTFPGAELPAAPCPKDLESAHYQLCAPVGEESARAVVYSRSWFSGVTYQDMESGSKDIQLR